MSLAGFQARNHRQQVGRRGALDKVDDRRTPLDLWNPLHEEFGFTIDVAATKANALTERYYDLEANGLEQSWVWDRVWCNPPYSNLSAWAAKADFEVFVKGCKLVVMLLPANRTEQGWWQEYIEPGRRAGNIETRFLRGRLRFDTPDHDYTKQPKGNRPPFGVVLVIWRRPTETGQPIVTGALAKARLDAFDRSACGNGPDEYGAWPCDPRVLLGGREAECQVCGRIAAWVPK